MRKKWLPVIALVLLLLMLQVGCQRVEFIDHETTPSLTPIRLPDPTPVSIIDDAKESESPSPTPTPTEEPIKEKQTLTLLAVGDVMCHLDNLKSAYDEASNTYDFKPFFEYVKPYIQQADVALANLETVTAGKQAEHSSFPQFNTPDAILEALAHAGFDVLSTVNNHSLDRGKEGLIRTIDKIEENNMKPVGTKKQPGDRFIFVEEKGFKIAVLSYSYAFNGLIGRLSPEEQQYMVNQINEAHMKSDIEEVKERGADAVLVYMHWGTEYVLEPNAHQKELTDKIFQWGGDIIFGSHPHVIQGAQIRNVDGKDKYVIYSMGNFISNFRKEDRAERPNKEYTEDGIMVTIELIKNEEGNTEISFVKHIPTWVYKYWEQDQIHYRILPIPDDSFEEPYITEKIKDQVKLSYTRTMGLVQDHKVE